MNQAQEKAPGGRQPSRTQAKTKRTYCRTLRRACQALMVAGALLCLAAGLAITPAARNWFEWLVLLFLPLVVAAGFGAAVATVWQMWRDIDDDES